MSLLPTSEDSLMSTLMTHARFHRLDHMALKDLRALDRTKTVVMIPVGMVEEHGDHLPLGTDNFAVEGSTLAAASWLLDSDADLHVLMLPLIPYGTDPVDKQRPDLFEQAGSVWISRETLKRIVAEVAAHMVRYGFRYIFPLGFHGGPEQSVALDEVCTEMRAQQPGLVMYEPMGYVMAGAEKTITPGIATLLGRPLTPKEEVALKTSIHASMFETSMMLYLRPDLVDPKYKHLRTIEWREMFEMKDWPGYIGAGPSHSNAEVGGAVLRWRGVRAGAVIRRAMAGEDLSQLPRHPKWLQDGPMEEEIPPAEVATPQESHVDSKPVMNLSGDELRQRMADVLNGNEDKMPGSDDNVTPVSSTMKTAPRLPRLRPSDPTPPESGS